MSPAEALAYAMRNIDPNVPEQSIDRFDVAAAEDIVRRLGHIGWWLVPSNTGITQSTTAAATSARGRAS
jgi:hypothetical protein